MYEKTIWVDQNVERPKTYDFSQNKDGSYLLLDSFGEVVNLGTPVNAENMNHIEEGISANDLRITEVENQKASISLDNLTEEGENKLAPLCAVSRVSIMEAGYIGIGEYSYSLAEYLPDDDNIYEVYFTLYVSSTNDAVTNAWVSSDIMPNRMLVGASRSGSLVSVSAFSVYIGPARTLIYRVTAAPINILNLLSAHSYRRVRINE